MVGSALPDSQQVISLNDAHSKRPWIAPGAFVCLPYSGLSLGCVVNEDHAAGLCGSLAARVFVFRLLCVQSNAGIHVAIAGAQLVDIRAGLVEQIRSLGVEIQPAARAYHQVDFLRIFGVALAGDYLSIAGLVAV